MIENPVASKKRTREIQEKYNAVAKKSFGQNFIVESGVVEKIARAAVPDQACTVVEVGPGIGALTQYLCEYAKKVVAFEIDERMIHVLSSELPEPNLEVVHQDFLDVNLDEWMKKLGALEEPVVFASNLPYYITTPILFKLFEASIPMERITVMMQKEVASRFMAKANDSDYNALSVITQYRADVKKIMDVNRNVFWPSPNVSSTVLQFILKKDKPVSQALEPEFFEMIKACFKQRRKTLLNNLQAWLDDKKQAAALLKRAGIDPALRAQQCSIEVFEKIFDALCAMKGNEND